MKKIQLTFLFVFLIVFITSFFIFNRSKSPISSEINKISEFQITNISENGKIYSSSEEIINLSTAKTFSIMTMNYSNELFLKSDPQTSFGFFYFGIYFITLPDSYIYFQPKTKEFHFFSGEFYWNRESGDKKVEISIKNQDLSSAKSVQKIITLSDSGRLKIEGNTIKIWNYTGNLKFNYDKQENNLEMNQLLELNRNQKIKISDILPPPEFISPENKIISLKKIGDNIVKFNWKTAKGANNYLFKLYSSNLKENVLYNNLISSNRVSLDLLKFENIKEFYWEVFPYDLIKNTEGSPSKMGYIKMIGSLIKTADMLKPPKLDITSISASGNVVLIKGVADKDSKLYINDELKNIDMDGTFFHTLTFKTLGVKTIYFRLVSSFDKETKIERQVQIFEE